MKQTLENCGLSEIQSKLGPLICIYFIIIDLLMRKLRIRLHTNSHLKANISQ